MTKIKLKNKQHQSSALRQPFFSPNTIQPKLTIGQPNDKYKQEADAMADKVMRMKLGDLKNKPNGNTYLQSPQIQTKCAACAQEEKLQTKPLMVKAVGGGGIATQSFASKLNNSNGSGSQLPFATNKYMSQAFGNDFSHVKIHTDSDAIQMNNGLNSRAFTQGSDIYFNKGEYAPNSSAGKKLLAHELTHVVQQISLNSNNKVQRQVVTGRPSTRSELEAEPQFNWGLNEVNLSIEGNRPFIDDGVMVSGMGYVFGLKFASNCSQSLVQSVQTRNNFFNNEAENAGGYGNQFMELFRIDNGQAAGIDIHSHPMPSPRYLESQGITGTNTHCLSKELQICCGNYGGFVLPRNDRYAQRRYNPQNFNCEGPTTNYQINYCTNGTDYSLRVDEFGININALSGVPRHSGLLAHIDFTIELQERLDRFGVEGTRELRRFLILSQEAKQFVQTNGIDGAEAVFYARGDITLASRYLTNIVTIRQYYNNCMRAFVAGSSRTPAQWSVFVRNQLTRPNRGQCNMLN